MAFTPDSNRVARVAPSPNYGERRAARPDMIVLHYTGMPDAEAALERLCAPGSEVSAHYVVLEDGAIVQCVPEARRAWHAGVSSWGGETDINSHSIGIEVVNPGHEWGYRDFPPAQIDAVIALCRDIVARHAIAPQRVLAHSDVAPARKQDPGEKFPWGTLHAAGVGHWVRPAAIEGGPVLTIGDSGSGVRALQEDFADFGYGITATGHYDEATALVVVAFQRHFRPERVDGVADVSTLTTLRALLTALQSEER
jgi:N-acetylmuramoyl-L-alanine amidase